MRAVLRRAALLMTVSTGAGVLAAGMVVAAAGPAAAAGQQLYAYAGGTASPSGCPQDTTSNPSNECSFGAALTQANPGDTIYLATPGGTAHYVGNWTINTSTSASAPLTIEPEPGVSNPTLDGDKGASCPTGTCDGPVLEVPSGEFVALSGITITNGRNTGGDAGAAGGAVDNHGTVTITDSTFSSNNAEGYGGAISSGDSGGGGSLTVTGSTFTGNTGGNGGAISSAGFGRGGSLTVTGSTFSGNESDSGGAIDNGAGSAGGTASVTGSTFSGNIAFFDGGAIDSGNGLGAGVGGGSVTVTDSTFTSNTAEPPGGSCCSEGGAIASGADGGAGTVSVTGSTFSGNGSHDGGAIASGDAGGGTVTVATSTFSGNDAANGGAIDSGDEGGGGKVSVTGSTFSGNNAGNDGGAIDNGDASGGGTVTVAASTFSGNSAAVGGGAIDSSGGSVTVAASTLTGDGGALDGSIFTSGGESAVQVAGDVFDGSCAPEGEGTWTDGGYNAGRDSSCFNSGPGDVNAGSSAALGLGSLADNGGPTQTIMPAAGSAVIGIIPDPTTITLGSTQVALCPATDQRGYTSAASTACDAGALQTTGVPAALTTTAHPKSVTLGTTPPVLTDSAALSGGTNPGGTITFTLDDPSGTVVYTDHVTVSGDGTYTTAAGDNPGGYTLPTAGAVTGTYTWHAAYSGDSANNPLSDQGDAAEKTTVSPASPAITTTPGNTVVTGTALTDSAALSSGYSPSGTITFTLYNPSNNAVYTDHVTVSGNGTYTTAVGDNPGGYTPTAAGSYRWTATYNGDGNNDTASESGEQQTALYGFGGYSSPLSKTTLQKSGSTIPVKFQLTNAAGQPISPSAAAALAAAGDVKATLTGPGISPVTALCTWDSTHQLFQCNLKTPTGLKTGTANPYQITAYENVGTGFVQAPAVDTAVNPENIYFK